MRGIAPRVALAGEMFKAAAGVEKETPEQFDARMRRGHERFRDIVKALKPEYPHPGSFRPDVSHISEACRTDLIAIRVRRMAMIAGQQPDPGSTICAIPFWRIQHANSVICID